MGSVKSHIKVTTNNIAILKFTFTLNYMCCHGGGLVVVTALVQTGSQGIIIFLSKAFIHCSINSVELVKCALYSAITWLCSPGL